MEMIFVRKRNAFILSKANHSEQELPETVECAEETNFRLKQFLWGGGLFV